MSVHTFGPFYQERIWGGQALGQLYGRALPEGKQIGESWELVDRPNIESPLEGEEGTLHDLWAKRRVEAFGRRAPDAPRFPILVKLLDCRETLSVQVHPPAEKAAALGGEPKTEMWYFLHTEPEAKIYAGFRKGVTAESLRASVGTPQLAESLHQLPTAPGEAMFLPSGRVHAIGAGNVILEIQQNSDTTYRLDDWGRVDASGKPRELHKEQALASAWIDDPEPFFAQPHGENVVTCAYFKVGRVFLWPGEFRDFQPGGESFHYHFVARGSVTQEGRTFRAGQGWLVTADHPAYQVEASEEAELVTVRFP
ncbi:MAG: class I mannose-6-phosphate isomerase [Verrucomicrobium sp.]|nr:class I mannose-6-phosphate isomerase [Verrucomicrobium sp.]